MTSRLPEGWKKIKLGEVANIISGGTPKRKEQSYWNGNIQWISIKDFLDNEKYIEATQERITKKGFENSSTNILYEDDIIISARGTVGKLAIIRYPMAFNQSCYGLRAKESIIANNHYLYYFLKYDIDRLKSLGHGSVFNTIIKSTLENLIINLPSMMEQKIIADSLSVLDDKIELNNKMNKNLEEQAQAIFKHWFIDFKFPDDNGNPYKSSGGEMVESELGMIPKGWEVGTLNDLGDVVGGSTPSRKKTEYFTTKGIPWITPKDLSNNKNIFIDKGEEDITEQGFNSTSVKILPKGTVLFSSRAPIGYIAIAKNDVTTNQGFKSILPNKSKGLNTIYIFCWLKENTENIENRASGSTFKEISGGELKKVTTVIPNKEILKRFEGLQKYNFKKIEVLEDENKILKTIRNTLLPKLMSGEVRLPLD